jgi:hypothetical protein
MLPQSMRHFRYLYDIYRLEGMPSFCGRFVRFRMHPTAISL